jgi:RNA polymerase sigma-70 factor (ECF subfamily)
VRLVERTAAGDRDALGELYDRFAPLLRALARRMVEGEREAEALVQDAFVDAWRSAGRYDPAVVSVRTWLLLALRRRAVDRIGGSAGRLAGVAEGAPPGDALDAGRAAALRAVSSLPPEAREVLELGYYGGLPAAEIAGRLGVSVETVRARLVAGIEHLRARLDVLEGLS